MSLTNDFFFDQSVRQNLPYARWTKIIITKIDNNDNKTSICIDVDIDYQCLDVFYYVRSVGANFHLDKNEIIDAKEIALHLKDIIYLINGHKLDYDCLYYSNYSNLDNNNILNICNEFFAYLKEKYAINIDLFSKIENWIF
jgi:hypothetical protein